MRSWLGHFTLVGVVVAAVPLAVACGEVPQGPGPVVPGTATAEPTAPGTPTAPPAGTGTGATTPHGAPGPMKPTTGSAMADDLKKIGLDPKNLPPLNKLEPDKIRAVMGTFKKALGVECTGCHDANNFKAPTPHKKIATKMWDEFVRKMAMEDGSVLYCDSCHGGHMEFLDRKDKKALSAWMDANFVGKLKRVDKKDQSCETCHGDPFEPNFVAQWAK
ncbi:MAG: hypothetical protein KF819_11640 [Labilithrix sp.]|nr:hypothetical protein [Labilithrix sp.]